MKIFLFYISLISIGFADISDEPTKPIPDSKAPYRTNFAMPEFPPTDQDTLWAQYPNPSVALGLACQHDPAYPFDAWVVDDVVPPSYDYQVEEVISWWANWQVFISWAYVDEVYFQVYEDSGLGYPFPKIMPSQEVTVLPANFTATTIGTDQYLLEMTLPSTVTLPVGEISWVCVQPSNEFSVNGQTGWMGEVGIGNGQELYFAFPLVGTDKWATATQQWGFAYEAGFALLGTEGGGGSELDWDFEDGTWQDWTHTNNQVYPAGWGVIDAGTANWPPPDMGNYCLGIDDDAAGSGTSVIDTAKSPVFGAFYGDWLHWGIGYNSIGSDWVDVVIAYYDNGSWNYDVVRHYTSDQGGYSYGIWDSVDVSGYTAEEYQIMFIYNDGGTWAWWCEIDNIGPPWWREHDVGSVTFLSPGTQVSPAYYDVIGVVNNFGDFDEAYDVHCVITDPTFARVLDTTITVMTPVDESDTINFGYINFVSGYTYDLMMATLLPGDEYPGNDTLEQVTIVFYGGYWDSLANIDQGRSGAYAGEWRQGWDMFIYYFGGNPGPLASAFKYDGISWTSIPSMPVGSSYGGNASIDGKIYLVSAWTGQNGLLTIFDCESETYSSINMPVAVADPAVAVYQNNYIYSIGGSNPPGWAGSTIVQLYDIEADSFWTQVTQLPASSYVTTATAGYIGNDTLIVSGGYDAGATNKTTMGAIDPGNPANVTWSSGTPHPGAPAYRCYGGDISDGEYLHGLVVVGGSPYTAQAHMYLSNTGWITLPDKITACSNSGAVDVDLGWYFSALYTVGGYTGSYLNIFERYVLQWHWGIKEQPDENVSVFAFSPGSPNPVTEKVRFTLSLPLQGSVHFQVFDATGRQVLDSHYSSISQGEHTLFWNLRDDRGREVPAGSYFYRLEAGEHSATGKIVVVK